MPVPPGYHHEWWVAGTRLVPATRTIHHVHQAHPKGTRQMKKHTFLRTIVAIALASLAVSAPAEAFAEEVSASAETAQGAPWIR